MASVEPRGDARPRVLIIAEAATLAHVTRPLALAQALDPTAWDVHFAVADNDLMAGKDFIFAGRSVTRWSIPSISSARFLAATQSGSRLYDLETLTGYVRDDLALLDRVRPDLVVGDLRLSLATSARLQRIPYAAITNAYWSPSLPLERFPTPEYAAGGRYLRGLVNGVARLALPLALRWHARPLNQVRRRFGLAAPGEFRAAYTDADLVLYADHPGLVPVAQHEPHHHHIGPVSWSPPVDHPVWWNDLPTTRRAVYVALGSSGRQQLLPALVDEVSTLGVSLMVASNEPAVRQPPVYQAAYLPGAQAAARSSLVICNGGSGSVYQALGAGVPVLGIAANMDQLLLMGHVERAGCGILLRASRIRPGQIAAAARSLLDDPTYRQAAQRLARDLAGQDAGAAFDRHLSELLVRSDATLRRHKAATTGPETSFHPDHLSRIP